MGRKLAEAALWPLLLLMEQKRGLQLIIQEIELCKMKLNKKCPNRNEKNFAAPIPRG